MHVDRFGASDVRADILDAAVSCKVYDPPCEGLPATWLADLCQSAAVVDDILARHPEGTHWDRTLRCALLKEFVDRGYLPAKQRLYENCQRTEYGDLFGADEIIQLDGFDGLVFLARKLGDIADADESFKVTDTSFWAFDDRNGEGEAMRLLEQEALHDGSLRAYIAHVASESQDAASSRPLQASFHEYISSIRTSDRVMYGATHRGRHVEAVALEPVLQIALSDTEPLVLENALRCLSGSKTFPLQTALLPLLRHENAKVRLFCARTLGHHVDARLREAGLAALSNDMNVALELLRKNARPEDAETILAALRPLQNDVEQHDVAVDVTHMLRENSDVRDVRLALYVYEYSPCQNCRGSVVKMLIDWKACPSWVLEEGLYDASGEIRELCANWREDNLTRA
jgi:hypothetical protein